MKYIKNTLISILLIGASLGSYAQYAGQYIGVTINLESVPHTEFLLEVGSIVCTTAPTCVVNAMSFDNPGSVEALQGYSYTGGDNLIIQNSQHLSLCQGSAPSDPNGITRITPINTMFEKGINIDRLWVGRQATPVSIPQSHLIIDTQYDSLIVDEVWVPYGATLEIIGPNPLIVRKELHNKGTIICDENLLIPVTTDYPDAIKGFHALFEQKGEVIGRYSAEVMRNERPEFLNWDWVIENFGQQATYIDSLQMLGLDPYTIGLYEDVYESHLLEGDPWYMYKLQLDGVEEVYHQFTMSGAPVKGVRFGGQYKDYARVALYKDASPRFPYKFQWPEETTLPTGYNFLSELGEEIAAIYMTQEDLNYYHNVILNNAPEFFSNGNINDYENYSDSYTTGEWERVSFMRQDYSNEYGYSTGIRTRYQYGYDSETDTYIGEGNWWPWDFAYEHPGYPDNVPFPWVDPETGALDYSVEQITPEYLDKMSYRDYRTLGASLSGSAFTSIDTDLEEIFVSFDYCLSENIIHNLEGPLYFPNPRLVNNPIAQGIDTVWTWRPGGCTDTIVSAYGMFDAAQTTNSGILWNFYLMNDPTQDNIWNLTEMMERDTTVAGYDSIYDYNWYYRNELEASQSIFNGWDIYFSKSPDVAHNSYREGSFFGDIETMGSNGNQIWENPIKSYIADTAGRFMPQLYGDVINWDSILASNNYYGNINLAPKLDSWLPDIPELGYMMNFYPDSMRMDPVETNPTYNWWGADWVAPDHSTPQPFPTMSFQYVGGVQNTEWIDRYTGYSWMNTLDAYNDSRMTYHPQTFESDPIIPNLPPNNSEDHLISYKLPTATDWVYTYAPNGLLYEAQTWSECLEVNDTTFCINYFNGVNQAYDEWGISTENDLTGISNSAYDDADLELAFNNYYTRRNKWGPLANPIHGYLDLDLVADNYFENYPESNHLEFAWWNPQNTTGTSNTNPGNVLNGTRKYWRRKYHRYGDEIVSDEIEYFLTLLTEQFLAQNGEGFSNELTEVILSFLNNEGIAPGTPAFNWLIGAPVNPNGYVGIGQYAMPGSGVWARNSSGSPVSLEITADMGIYDFEWPLSTGNEVYLGSAGPGSDGTGYGGRAAVASQSSQNYTPADHSTIVVIDYVNDSTYMPWIFLHHRFMDDATNGSEQIFEDNHSSLPNFPWVFTDSTKVRASNYVEEYGPHNQQPLYVNIPQPLDTNEGAWCFIPTLFQDTGSTWYDVESGNIYNRLGLELFDSNGDITNIIYLDEGDTLWIRHNDPYDWPIKGKMYFTNLYGDINGDGIININDLLDLFAYFLLCEDEAPQIAYFDANGDGCITTSDFLVVLANFGGTVGSAIGDFSGTVWDEVGPERLAYSGNRWDHPDWPTAEIEAAFVGGTFPSIYENGNVDAAKILNMPGENIQVFNSRLNSFIEGQNSIQLPTTGGPYFIVTDRTVSYYDVTEVPDVVTVTVTDPTISDVNGGKTAVLPSLAAAYPEGANQFWTNFYEDMKTMDGGFDANNADAPTLAQVYYGINSGANANPLNLNNAKVEGLIDMFGAGDARHGYTLESSIGVQNDDRWTKTATGYTNFRQNRNYPLFQPTMIPLAYALPRVRTSRDEEQILPRFETQAKIDRLFNDGIAENFDEFSELSGRREPAVTEWGGDIKVHYDVPLHNGVLAMCDFMTLQDYFEFKMYGVSPKFGQTNAGSSNPRTVTESFGTVYNTGAVEGVPNAPGIGYAPSLCNNLADYSSNIVIPFLTANIGNVVVLPQDPTPVTQDGIQRNIDDAGHHNWFGNSAAFVHNGSFGPLVYDFNMNGTWDADDLTIWNNLVTVWTNNNIREGQESYSDASYYRPATDALNEAVNVIHDYEDGGSYYASWNFNKWFDATATADPFGYVDNWHACLNQPEWNLNLINPVELTTTAFEGTSVKDDSFLYNTDRTGFNPSLLVPTVLNNYGKVAIGDYVPAGDLIEYQVVPSSNYFPVTMYWHP